MVVVRMTRGGGKGRRSLESGKWWAKAAEGEVREIQQGKGGGGEEVEGRVMMHLKIFHRNLKIKKKKKEKEKEEEEGGGGDQKEGRSLSGRPISPIPICVLTFPFPFSFLFLLLLFLLFQLVQVDGGNERC